MDDDFSTMQSPAARAGASFHATIRNGKFQGTIIPTTPIGSLRIRLTRSPSRTLAEPSSDLMTPAKYLKWSTASGMSTPLVSLMGLPLSSVSTSARRSALASMRSAMSRRIFDLTDGSTLFQESNAFQAAFTALSTSFFVASAQSASFSPFAGLCVSNVPLSDAATHLPLMYSP